MNKSLDNTAKNNNQVVSPSIPKTNIKKTPLPESPDQTAIISKEKEERLPTTPPPATTTNHEADDFFD